MMSIPVKGTEAQQVVDRFQHDLLHTEELLEMYPDLSVVTTNTNTTTSIHEVEYFSTSICSEVDLCEFTKEDISVFAHTHVVHPYKNIQLSCPKCKGIVRINSNPHRIPIFLEHESSLKNYTISCFVYEDLLKSHNFNGKVLSETQLYIISKLEERRKNNHELNIFALSNSIKKLLPFS